VRDVSGDEVTRLISRGEATVMVGMDELARVFIIRDGVEG
jgi:hypothetical protein